MRFMILIKASKDSEAGVMPGPELFTAMGNYNEELIKAGVLVSGDGLKPSSHGARMQFKGDERLVTPGPFRQVDSLVAGYWVFEVPGLDDAIEWVKRAPNPMPGTDAEIEIRPFYEMADFADVMPQEAQEQEMRMRRELEL